MIKVWVTREFLIFFFILLFSWVVMCVGDNFIKRDLGGKDVMMWTVRYVKFKYERDEWCVGKYTD